MWKKFFVALVSIAVLSTAGIISMQLHAESDTSIVVREVNHQASYIHEALEFEVNPSQPNEKILFIEGGNVSGNQESLEIPLQDDASTFVLEGVEKPGAYQGEIRVKSADLDGSNAQSRTANFSFVVYGKAFENENNQVKLHEEKKLSTYGILPQEIQQPTIVYAVEDERIATIDDAGLIKGNQVGKTTIWIRVYDEETLLSSDESQVEVVEESQPEDKTVLEGTEHGYRFIPLQEASFTHTTNQAIGSIQLGQSGDHTYQFDEEGEANLEIKEGIVSIKKEHAIGEYESSLLITNVQSKNTYRILITYRVKEDADTKSETFEFRYDGSATTNVIRTYQPGNNSFQLSSNQNVSEVTFRLKEENDTEFLTISKTGNVTVKKATTNPVMIVASYGKQTYELPVLIEKANQAITLAKEQLTLQLEDGEFEPTINGVKGNGEFIVSMQDEAIVQVTQKGQGNLVLLPKNVGETTITIYHAGDENYKESNRIELQVSIRTTQAQDPGQFIGTAEWLSMPETNAQGWHQEPFVISLKNDNPATSLLYQDQVVKEIACSENGETTFPIMFQNEEEQWSTPISMNVKLDTHAPIISSIEIQDVVDSEWKALLNKATFQQAYGTGKEVIIKASDDLVNLQQKTSGVKTVEYRVYSLKEEGESLLEEVSTAYDEPVSFIIDSEDTFKVCAIAMDQADLQSDEVCQMSNENPHIPTIQSENSGIMLRSMAFQGNEQFVVEDALPEVLQGEEQNGIGGVVTSAFAFRSNTLEQLDFTETPIQVVVPLTRNEVSQKGIWKQKQSDGSYAEVPSDYQVNACTLTITSLQPIVLVEGNDAQGERMEDSTLRLSSNDTLSNQIQNQVTPLLANRDWQIAEADVQALSIALGALVIGLLLIIAIRSHQMEDMIDDRGNK